MKGSAPLEFWEEHSSGITISSLGNSHSPITIHRGRKVIRKTEEKIQKRYHLARLVLECFPPPYMMQCSGQGNFLGRGTVVWKDGNSLNCSASNLMWKWSGPGWTEAQTLKLQGYIKKAMEDLSLTEKYPSYYLKLQ